MLVTFPSGRPLQRDEEFARLTIFRDEGSSSRSRLFRPPTVAALAFWVVRIPETTLLQGCIEALYVMPASTVTVPLSLSRSRGAVHPSQVHDYRPPDRRAQDRPARDEEGGRASQRDNRNARILRHPGYPAVSNPASAGLRTTLVLAAIVSPVRGDIRICLQVDGRYRRNSSV